MSALSKEQIDRLVHAIHTHEFLHRLMREIEKLQRVVFHSNEEIDVPMLRQSAEQILAAEIVSRHRGEFDGIYFALRDMEKGGMEWAAAIRDLAGRIHSYFTTPLGLIMRRDLFGPHAVYVSTDAEAWMKKLGG